MHGFADGYYLAPGQRSDQSYSPVTCRVALPLGHPVIPGYLTGFF
ncbi:hypothetical protein BMETH_1783_1 [methanotrophic bacterial endosymbiont of Bathymodiolus sp.]|nr:hypothetical protein BMETH_1783_1 [methanotrophic bacterial endosymbiont of Bathymodiolus sp.]